MAAIAGNTIRLLIEEPADSGTYINVGGTTSITYTVNNEQVDITDMFSNGNRELVAGAGNKTYSISYEFIPKGANSDPILASVVHGDTFRNFRLSGFFPSSGDYYQGEFQIASYERSGANGDVEKGTLNLESDGQVSLVTPSSSTPLEYTTITVVTP